MNILIGISGSVASIKLAPIISEFRLRYKDANFKIIATNRALQFINKDALDVEILTDNDEWKPDYKIGDPVLHIQVR